MTLKNGFSIVSTETPIVPFDAFLGSACFPDSLPQPRRAITSAARQKHRQYPNPLMLNFVRLFIFLSAIFLSPLSCKTYRRAACCYGIVPPCPQKLIMWEPLRFSCL